MSKRNRLVDGYEDDEDAETGDGEGDDDMADDEDDVYEDVGVDGNVTRRTITLIKSNTRKVQSNEEYTSGSTGGVGVLKESNTTNRRMSRARRLPAWYKDYDTDFVMHEEGVMDREEVQAQLPPGIELEDPSAVDKEDVPTEEWNIVVYDDDDDDDEDEDEGSPIDYEDEDSNVINDGGTCDTTGLLNVHAFT